ncbi:MAG: hypothetical protein RDA78_25700 [Roseibium sp.]|uniref:hypothetical protein n=1 Tax=Roseibium sp. TaxID=1936156 RepID=UPI003D9C0C56
MQTVRLIEGVVDIDFETPSVLTAYENSLLSGKRLLGITEKTVGLHPWAPKGEERSAFRAKVACTPGPVRIVRPWSWLQGSKDIVVVYTTKKRATEVQYAITLDDATIVRDGFSSWYTLLQGYEWHDIPKSKFATIGKILRKIEGVDNPDDLTDNAGVALDDEAVRLKLAGAGSI